MSPHPRPPVAYNCCQVFFYNCYNCCQVVDPSNARIDPTTQQLICEICTCRYASTSATGGREGPEKNDVKNGKSTVEQQKNNKHGRNWVDAVDRKNSLWSYVYIKNKKRPYLRCQRERSNEIFHLSLFDMVCQINILITPTLFIIDHIIII